MTLRPTVAVLGATGLIGQAVAETLAREGFPIVAIGRRFTPAQAAVYGATCRTVPITRLDDAELTRLLGESHVDIVLNCVGVLQDGRHGATRDVHEVFVARLLRAIAAQPKPVLLIHLSIPGAEEDDCTGFSRTKRGGERLIRNSGRPFVILRPGFVVAPVAYGGGALIRSLAMVPMILPSAAADRLFFPIAVGDIARTVALVGRRWQDGERDWNATWDLMARQPATTVGTVVAQFRRRFGGPPPRWPIPAWLLHAGAMTGDVAAHLGWSPPMRTTALREMLRGVAGHPDAWIAATGLEPATLDDMMADLPASIQERWFARLFLAKPLILATLALFWIVSGLIPLALAFGPAVAVMTSHGLPRHLAAIVTTITGLADVTIGVAIAWRQTCRAALGTAIVLSLLYLASASLVASDLWLDPVGALVKTGPVIVLMGVALMILDDR